MFVAGAAAEVARDGGADLQLCRVGIAVQQGLGAQDKARRAEAALQRVVIDDGLLQRVQDAALGQPLDRRHPFARDGQGQHQAGIDRLAVHDDGAGTALADTAALFCPRQVTDIPQDIEKPQVFLHLDAGGFVI